MTDLPEPLPSWCAPHVIRVDPDEHEEAPRDRSLAPAQFVYYVRADAYEALRDRLQKIHDGTLVCSCPLNSLQTSINCPLHGA